MKEPDTMDAASLMASFNTETSDPYREIFYSNPVPMCVIDLKTLSFLAANQAAQKLYGYTEEEFLTKTLMDVRPPEEISRLLDRLSVTGSLNGAQGSWKHRRKDGTILPVMISSAEIIFHGRKAVLTTILEPQETISRGLEEKVEIERRKLEERYRTLFEESKDTIFISTPGGRFLDINPAGVELFGYSSKNELLHVNLTHDMFVDAAERESYKEELGKKGFVKDYQIHLKRKDGTVLTVLETSVVVRNANFEIVACRGIIRDITNEKELQKQLFQAQKMETIGRLAGVVAHDFNNILMAISGYCELLEMQSPLDETKLKALKQIKKSTDKGGALTRQLLALSRHQVLEPKIINLSQLLSSMEPMLKRLLGEEITLDCSLGKETGNVKVDPSQIEQVILNLVVNARDAMSGSGVLRIETSVVDLDHHFVSSHLGSHAGRHVKLTVTDNGSGMSDNTISHVFEPFFTTKEKGKGTGLGLSIVYSAVRQSGGYVTVKSKLMKGTTFEIYLPQVSEPVFRSGSFKRKRTAGTETILVVDDNDSVRESVTAMLQLTGYSVLAAGSGSEALKISEEHQQNIHLVVSDLAMPSMNGWQLATQLKAARPTIKILLMSGYPEQLLNTHEGLEFEFLEKPVSMEILLTTIRQILDRATAAGDPFL